MAILSRLEEFLKKNSVKFKTVTHPEVFTAQEMAAEMHVSGKELAKVVMVKAGDRFVMMVLPASRKLDFKKLKETLEEKEIRLASEDEFKGLFPDCEPGAEPPFGNLYGVKTIVDTTLTEDEHIFFNAGNHYEAVEMAYKDYTRLAKPEVGDFSSPSP